MDAEMFAPLPEALPYLKSGKLTALALMSAEVAERFRAEVEIPTALRLCEAGLLTRPAVAVSEAPGC